MLEPVLREDLMQVAARGAPAQVVEAQRLLACLDLAPGDEGVTEAARQLVDAYLHDPYLERG